MSHSFFKYHGCGNDFVIFDDTDSSALETILSEKVEQICHRRFGVGADGVIFLQTHSDPDVAFNMRYYNADGSLGSLCGNGARCAVKCARDVGVLKSKGMTRIIDSFQTRVKFVAADGPHYGDIQRNGTISDNANKDLISIHFHPIDLNTIEEINVNEVSSTTSKDFFIDTGDYFNIFVIQNDFLKLGIVFFLFAKFLKFSQRFSTSCKNP